MWWILFGAIAAIIWCIFEPKGRNVASVIGALILGPIALAFVIFILYFTYENDN